MYTSFKYFLEQRLLTEIGPAPAAGAPPAPGGGLGMPGALPPGGPGGAPPMGGGMPPMGGGILQWVAECPELVQAVKLQVN